MSADHLRGMNLGGLVRATDVQWGANATSPLMSVGADGSVELLDFPLAGQLTWTPNRDGSSNLGLLVALPEAFGGVSGETAVKINPGGDMSFDRLRIEVGEVPVHGFELGRLRFLYDRSRALWQGGGEVALPTTSKVRVGASVSVQHGQFQSFEGYVNGLNQHIAYGVYLQRLGVPVGRDSVLHLGGDIGFSAGPRILGVGALAADGHYDLYPDGSIEHIELEDGGARSHDRGDRGEGRDARLADRRRALHGAGRRPRAGRPRAARGHPRLAREGRVEGPAGRVALPRAGHGPRRPPHAADDRAAPHHAQGGHDPHGDRAPTGASARRSPSGRAASSSAGTARSLAERPGRDAAS